MKVKALVLMMALALAATPLAIAQGPPEDTPGGPPDETPGTPPDETPDGPPDGYPPESPPAGPPEEFPGPGDFPADPSQHFPEQACQYVPDRPGNVPGWVVIPFQNCADEGEDGEGDGSGGSTTARENAPVVPILP